MKARIMSNYMKLLSFLVGIVLIIGTVEAYGMEFTIEGNEYAEEVLLLSLEEACDMAVENSYPIRSMERKIENTKDLVDSQEDLQESIEDLLGLPLEYMPDDITNDFVNKLLIKKGYGVKGAEVQLLILENTLKQTEEALRISVSSTYYNVLAAEKSFELNRELNNNALFHQKNAAVKYEIGVITKLQLLQAELSVNSSRLELESAEDTLGIRKLELNNVLDIDFDQHVEFATELERMDMVSMSLEQAIDKAISSRPEIMNKKAEYELEEVENRAITSYYTPRTRQYKYAEEELEEAYHDYEQSYRDIELEVRHGYMEYENTVRALENMDETIELSREALRVTRLYYENDLATLEDVLDGELSLAKAEIGRCQMAATYNVTRIILDNSISTGMPSGF